MQAFVYADQKPFRWVSTITLLWDLARMGDSGSRVNISLVAYHWHRLEDTQSATATTPGEGEGELGVADLG